MTLEEQLERRRASNRKSSSRRYHRLRAELFAEQRRERDIEQTNQRERPAAPISELGAWQDPITPPDIKAIDINNVLSPTTLTATYEQRRQSKLRIRAGRTTILKAHLQNKNLAYEREADAVEDEAQAALDVGAAAVEQCERQDSVKQPKRTRVKKQQPVRTGKQTGTRALLPEQTDTTDTTGTYAETKPEVDLSDYDEDDDQRPEGCPSVPDPDATNGTMTDG